MLSKLMNSRYEQNGEILILYNTTHSQSERDILVKEQGDGTSGNLIASNQISYGNRVIDEDERNLASKEQERASIDSREHSLTKCPYCETVFPYSLVELHAQTCSGNVANQTAGNDQENVKRCQYCRSIFPDSSLEQHIQTCSQRKIHQCSECNKVFRIRSKLLIHQQSHSDERSHSCHICAKTFKFKSGLTRHMRQQHSGGETTDVKTTLCEELQGLEYSSLQDDVNGGEEENSVKEGENFGLQHFDKPKTDLKTSRRRVECGSSLDDVNHQTSNDYQMVVYENRHENYKENNFVKQHSDAATTDLKTPRQGQEKRSYLQKGNDQDSFKENEHRESTESNIRGEMFRKDKNSFEIEEKYLKRNNAVECEENDIELNFEMNPGPSGIFSECYPNVTPPFNTQNCGDSKVYKCQECPRIFAKPSRLAIHRRTHSDEKLFTCGICQQTFKYKGSLNRHVKEQHYGQGRKSFSMVIDGQPRKEPENCSSVEKIEFRNDDMYLMNVDESNDGVFRHWKERHYSQGRKSFSMMVDERNELENSSSLEKTKFDNDECLVSLKKSLQNKDEVGHRESLSKVVDERNENCSSWEKMKSRNDDQDLLKQHEDLENKETRRKSLDKGQNVNFRQDGKTVAPLDESSFENEENNAEVQKHVQQEQNNLSMIFDERQEDEESLSSQDEISFENVYNTNERNARDNETFIYGEYDFGENSLEQEENNVSMVFDRGQGGEKSLSSQDESSFENMDNSTESHTINTETCKYGESDFEVQESLRQAESGTNRRNLEEDSFELGEDHSEEGENIFEVKSRPTGASNECFTNALVNIQRGGEDKLYQCDVCQKYIKRSTWWNHKLTHNDDMSFTCEFCWKYFKYKGSLSRHVKEQHYGLGRRSVKMALDKSLGNNISCSTQERDSLHKEEQIIKDVHCEESNSNEIIINRRMICDKKPGNDNSCSSKTEYSSQKGVNNYGAILNEGDNRDVNFKEKSFDPSMIFDKTLGNNNIYSSQKKVNNFGSTKNDEKLEQSNTKVKEKHLNTKHGHFDDAQSNDATKLMEGDVYMQENDNLDEGESSLQETQQEEGTLANRQYQFDACHDNLENLPSEITCEICGKCFKHKGSLTRHVKEQHYGLGRKSLKMVPEENQGKVNCLSSSGKDSPRNRVDSFGSMNEVNDKDGDSKDRNVNPSVKFIASQGINDVREEAFEVEQSDFEMKEIDENEHSEKDNFIKENSFENVLHEVDQEERTSESQQDNFDDERTDGATMAKEGFAQENDNLNKNGRSFEHDFQEIDQEERQLDSKQDSFNAYDDKFENSRVEFSCDFCGKHFKHQPSLCRHVKEQHYGLRRKSSKMVPDENQGKVDCLPSSGKDSPRNRVDSFGPMKKVDYRDGDSKDRNINPSVKFIASQGINDVREEAFEVEQSDFEMKESDENEHSEMKESDENEHSEKDNFIKGNSFENVLDEIDQEERTSESQQDNFDDEQTNNATMAQEGFAQENDHLNKNGCSFEHDLQEIDQEERQLDSKQDSFNAHDDKFENSRAEFSCDFCGKHFKHQPSLCRHVKEQHYGMRRKSSRVLSSERQNNANSCSSQKNVNLPDEFSNPKAILNDNNDGNLKEKSCEPRLIFDEEQGSENGCSSLRKDHLQNSLGETVKEVDNDYKDENSEQSNFEIKETSEHEQNHTTQNKENDFQQRLQEIEQEKRKLEHDNVDVYDEKLENVQPNVSEESKVQQSHLKMERCSEVEVFKCEDCPKMFRNRTALRKHKRIHSDEMSFTCEFCQQTFKYKGSLNRHVKEQHYGLGRKSVRKMSDERVANNSECSTVGKVNPGSIVNEVLYKDINFTEKNCEQNNVEKRTTDKRQVGDVATTSKEGKFFMQEKSTFKRKFHENQQQETNLDTTQENFVHDRLERAKNRILQEQSSSEMKDQNLDITQNNFDAYHLEYLKDKKIHRCFQCPRTFWKRSELREHAYKHTDVKSFACALCGKAFKFRSGLVRHNRKEHKGTRLIENVVSENKNPGIEGFSEETLQQERGAFENDLGNKEYSEFREGFRRIKPTKRKISGGDERSRVQKRCLNSGSEDSSDFGEDFGASRLRKRKFGGGDECFKTIVNENSGIQDGSFSNSLNEEISTQSVRQNLPIKKKPSMYNCNKCDATFKDLCDFLAHQRIHK
ncbi:---NA--- [Paramuricea clavata]|uniref:---NA n=1 Tax=Paramuricea clavata TaxID=317549 RepID=A0A6S7G1N5_PARCT|nr:---NA--- [Paramuricea clavata]